MVEERAGGGEFPDVRFCLGDHEAEHCVKGRGGVGVWVGNDGDGDGIESGKEGVVVCGCVGGRVGIGVDGRVGIGVDGRVGIGVDGRVGIGVDGRIGSRIYSRSIIINNTIR